MPDTSDLVLETTGLSKSFGGFHAVKEVDLAIRRDSIHAIIGPNGAGKTTLFNLLTKVHQPTAGRIVLDGVDITRTKPAAVARMGMVRSFQISATFASMTSLENVRIAIASREGVGFRFWQSSHALRRFDDEAEALLSAVGLAEYRTHLASELPYGRKRALEIATTLALEPKVLLLDEPTSGMGHEDVDKTADLVRRVSKNRTVVLVEHNLSVVSTLSDKITVLARGQKLAEGDYATVSADPRVVEAYLGTGLAA